MKTDLIEVIKETGIEENTATNLTTAFAPFLEQAKKWKEQAQKIVVTDESQIDLMKDARELRLNLRRVRIEAEKTRKRLKEDSLRYGKAVQGAYNIVEYLIAPLEEHLQDQEDFIKNREIRRMQELAEQRRVELLPYEEYVPQNIDLSTMSDDDYKKLLDGAKFQHDMRVKAEQEAEKKRKEEEEKKARYELNRSKLIEYKRFLDGFDEMAFAEYTDAEVAHLIKSCKEDEKKEAEEAERIRKENEKLKAEREKKEKEDADRREKEQEEKRKKNEELRKAKEEADKLQREKEERERLEAEKKAKDEEEAKKLAKAPDMEKIKSIAYALEKIEIPICSTIDGQELAKDISVKIRGLIQFIKTKSER